MRSWLFVLTTLIFTPCVVAAQDAAQETGDPRQRVAATYDQLAELAELGLTTELIELGLPAVEKDGALANDGQAAALVAQALFGAGREGEAFALLDAAQARTGDGSKPASAADRAALDLMRARLHLQRDELGEALGILAASQGKAPEPRYPFAVDNLLLLGRALVRLERFDLAEPMLRRFLDEAPLSPEAPSAWHMLFTCALQRGDVETAKACRAEKQRAETWHQLLVARKLQIRRDPDARLPRLGLALLWLEVDELEQARGALDAVIARYPNDADAWLHLGELHRRAGRLGDARRAWTQLLSMHPDEHRARYNLAILHRVEGRPAEARRELETLLASDAADDERFLGAHLELARLLQKAGETGAAQQRYAEYQKRGGTDAL